MQYLFQGLNILAIIFVIMAVVVYFMAVFTQKKDNSSRMGMSIDQAYGAANTLSVMAVALWIGIWYNKLANQDFFSLLTNKQ